MSGIDPDAELSSLLQDVEKLTNNSRVISRSIAQYAAVARAAAVAATHHNPESANDENDENGGGGGGGDGDHPAESLEEQTIELRLVIRDGLRRQEDNVEIASQKLDNICAVPVYWSSMSSTGPIFEDSQYGSAIEIKDKLGLTIAKLTDDLKRYCSIIISFIFLLRTRLFNSLCIFMVLISCSSLVDRETSFGGSSYSHTLQRAPSDRGRRSRSLPVWEQNSPPLRRERCRPSPLPQVKFHRRMCLPHPRPHQPK